MKERHTPTLHNPIPPLERHRPLQSMATTILLSKARRMRTIAFYLPQFHEIPENNLWWGDGFTEWTNTRRALPLYAGHAQPAIPGELGEYSLLNPEVLRSQSALARDAGIDGFCMYFYWFGGKRLLERPTDLWANDATLLPYCLSWANEGWTRRWDGKDKEVLIAQTYPHGYETELFESLLEHFRRPHYMTQDGCPILVVHRANLIPDVRGFSREMRRLARTAGLPGIHLVAAETQTPMTPHDFDFDAVAEFPPVGQNTLAAALLVPLSGVTPEFRGRLMSYPRLARIYMRRKDPGFARYRGVMPGWDNTPRRMTESTIYCGSSPSRYGAWLRRARAQERHARGSDGLVFINAWNEWAEGAYLEPDMRSGRAYLEATRDDGATEGQDASSARRSTQMVWSKAQARSLLQCAAGSALRLVRALRRRASRGQKRSWRPPNVLSSAGQELQLERVEK